MTSDDRGAVLAEALRPKRVGFLELFFDLVFVFAITQVVGLLHADHSPAGWGRAGLMLWLVWWAWSQYAWAGNAVDLNTSATRATVLAATGTMLVAAIAIPDAYGENGLWFALPHALVRLTGIGLYWLGLRGDYDQRAALLTYAPVAVLNPALVLVGGLVDPETRVLVWLAAAAVDLLSAATSGRGRFRIEPSHFSERHGLIVIVALGESLVTIGATATELPRSLAQTAMAAIAFITVGGMWWIYFHRVNPVLERMLATEQDHQLRSNLARDMFTLIHLPVVAGTITAAAGIEEALAHPGEPLNTFGAAAVALGPMLFLGGLAIGRFRATRTVAAERVAAVVLAGATAVVLGPRASAMITTGVIAAIIVAVAAAETARAALPGGGRTLPRE